MSSKPPSRGRVAQEVGTVDKYSRARGLGGPLVPRTAADSLTLGRSEDNDGLQAGGATEHRGAAQRITRATRKSESEKKE